MVDVFFLLIQLWVTPEFKEKVHPKMKTLLTFTHHQFTTCRYDFYSHKTIVRITVQSLITFTAAIYIYRLHIYIGLSND